MAILILFGIVLVLLFGFVLLFGAPYVPTMRSHAETALDLLDLKPGQTLLELGCGDGRVAVAAAQRGLNVVGYELNPLLAAIAWTRTRSRRGQVRIICGNFWRAKWPQADAVFVFLLPKYMSKLDTKIAQAGIRGLVSFAFAIPDREPDAEQNGVYLYRY